MMEYHAPKQPVKGLLTPLSTPLTACQEHGDEQLSGNAKEYAGESEWAFRFIGIRTKKQKESKSMDQVKYKCIALFTIIMLFSAILISCGAYDVSHGGTENSAEVVSAITEGTLQQDEDMRTSEDESAAKAAEYLASKAAKAAEEALDQAEKESRAVTETESAIEPDTSENKELPDLSLYSVKVLSSEDSDFAVTQDAEGNYYGAADFCIDGESVYILSTSTNTITEYQHQEMVRKIHFTEAGLNLIQFAVKGDIAYAYAVNPIGSYIVKYHDWKSTAAMSIYEFTQTDGFLDFYIIGDDLYAVTSGGPDCVTCLIHQEGDRLLCFETRNGKLVDGDYPVDYAKIRPILQEEAERQEKKDGLVLEVLQGCDDYGMDDENGHYYYSSEIVTDTETEYFMERIYHFDEEDQLQEVFVIPHGVQINTLRPVKIFFGKPWVLYVSSETTEVLLLQEAVNIYGIQ